MWSSERRESPVCTNSEDQPERPLDFPVELRIEREHVALRVDGRKRRFELYACGAHAAALGEINDVKLQITGARSEVETLSLRQATEEELHDLIAPRIAQSRKTVAKRRSSAPRRLESIKAYRESFESFPGGIFVSAEGLDDWQTTAWNGGPRPSNTSGQARSGWRSAT